MHRQKQEQSSGFRRVACTRTGTALASTCAICLMVALLAIAMCSTRTLTRAHIAAGCARSCRFLNSQIGYVIYFLKNSGTLGTDLNLSPVSTNQCAFSLDI